LNRLSRNLQITAMVDAISISMLFLIPSGNQGIRFSGFSTVRLSLLSLLGVLLGFLVWSLKKLHNNVDLEQSLEQYLHRHLQKTWIGKSIQFVAALVIILVIFFTIGNFIFANFQFRGIFLRLIPAFLLIMCIAIQILAFENLGRSGGRWAGILSYAILCTSGGVILQQVLLKFVGQPYRISFLLFLLNWLATFVVSVVLISFLSYLPKTERAVWLLVLVLAAVLFFFQWVSSSNRSWPTKLSLSYYGNLLVMGVVILTKIATDLYTALVSRHPQKSKSYLWGGLGIILIMLAILYYTGASAHGRIINTDLSERDQNAYINFAKNAKLSNFTYPGDFNRMPLYPFILAQGYRPGMSDQELFTQGKQISILLSLFMLSALFVIFTRFFSIFQAFLLMTISAFSLFIFKAAYVKVELLYYFFGFLTFILFLQMLQKPGKLLGITTGIALGLAYLSKATALLSLYIFTGFYLLMVLVSVIKLVREKQKDWQLFIPPAQRIFYISLTLLTFFSVTYPYTRLAKQRFGHYFYNINSTFYIWFDTIQAAMEANQKYGFTQKWPDQLSQDEIPGLQKYLREHSVGQIIDRLRFGMTAQAYNLYNQYTFTNFLFGYIAIFGLSVLVNLKNARDLIEKFPFLIGFSVLFILVHLLSCAWYSSLSAGPRFTYGIFLPLIFSLFAGIKGLVDYQSSASPGNEANPRLSKFSLAADMMMAGILIANIWLILSGSILSGQFGS
jgi:hypothetical protein